MTRRWLLMMLLVSGCAARAPLAPPPAPVVEPGDGVVVTLTWAAPVDLDLYVTDPTWETVYFANNPNRAGGRLERDERCGENTIGTRVELIRLPPAIGPYRVGVDFIDACGSDIDQASFRVVAAVTGDQREVTGIATSNVFAPIVLEVTVDRRDDGQLQMRGRTSQ